MGSIDTLYAFYIFKFHDVAVPSRLGSYVDEERVEKQSFHYPALGTTRYYNIDHGDASIVARSPQNKNLSSIVPQLGPTNWKGWV